MKLSKRVLVVAGGLLVILPLIVWLISRGGSYLQPPRAEELTEAIHLAAQYLTNQIEDDGRFVYRLNTNPRVKLPEKYNVLRHAGGIYSLWMYLKAYPNEEIKTRTLLATRYLIDHSLDRFVVLLGFHLVVHSRDLTRPEVSPSIQTGWGRPGISGPRWKLWAG